MIFLTGFSQNASPKYGIGVDLVGPSCPGSPVFIGAVRKISPAAAAGIQPGDQVMEIDGVAVKNFHDALRRLITESPGPVTLKLKRAESLRSVVVERENTAQVWSQNGMRILDDGLIVGSDYSEAELQEIHALNKELDRAVDMITVFPGHYPADKDLYFPGFEILVWNKGEEVHVGGIEDGPAQRSGVRWGDKVLSVDGVDPRRKALPELESLFSSRTPVRMQLNIERAGLQKTFTFQLAKAATVLSDNGRQIVNGKVVPGWVPAQYVACF